MAEADRERWDARYRERDGGPGEAAPFLVGLDPLLPRSGRALDVAGGSGRHALWLAERGLDVTLIDVSGVALDRARAHADRKGVAVSTVRLDVESEPLPTGPWDVVVCVYFLWRPLFGAFPSRLAAGGYLVVAHPTRTNLERHPRPGPEYLLDHGELRRLVSGLTVVSYDEGWRDGRHEAWLLARRDCPMKTASRP